MSSQKKRYRDPNTNRPPVMRSNDHLPPVWLDVAMVAWMLEAEMRELLQPTKQQLAEASEQLLELVRGSGFAIGAYDLVEILQFAWLASARNGIHLDELIPKIAEAMRRHAPAKDMVAQ